MKDHKAIKRTVVIILSAVILAAPFAAVIALAGSVKGFYSRTFTAELSDKYDRLYGAGSGKVVVVGGSSVCFGLDSELMEQELGRTVVDFGLYATLGTKVMLDLSLRAIEAGDTVIIAPELDRQTLSLYFNQEALLEALDGRYDMLKDVGRDNIGEVAGGFLMFLSKTLKLKRSGSLMLPDSIYVRDSFNEYGDVGAERPANKMTFGYDPNKPVELTPSIVSEDFIDYLNKYTDSCRSRGAEVWFSFCPVNRSGLAPGTTDGSIYEFYRFLSLNLNCRIISDINDYIMDEAYFYDTNFHLNDAGVKIRTQNLVRDVLRAEGDNRAVAAETPDIPATPTPGPTPELSENSDGVFIYRQYGKGLAIEGVAEGAKDRTELDIPREFNGVPVRAIDGTAFTGCGSLRKITVHDNITFIENRAFDLPSLEAVFLDIHIADDIEAGSDLFGSSGHATIYLPDTDAYTNFVTGYWWSIYSGSMEIGK